MNIPLILTSKNTHNTLKLCKKKGFYGLNSKFEYSKSPAQFLPKKPTHLPLLRFLFIVTLIKYTHSMMIHQTILLNQSKMDCWKKRVEIQTVIVFWYYG